MGYNLILLIDGKKIFSKTDDNFSITPTVVESITKDDVGNTNSMITGNSITFSASGMVTKKETGENTYFDNDDVLEMALRKGDDAVIEFVYQRSDLKAYQGSAIITGYTEDSNSTDIATYSLSLQVVGELTSVA